MAKSATPVYEPEAEYKVKLARPVTIAGGRVLRPLNEHIFRGAYLTKLVAKEGSDVVDTADRV
jgi:hypothetical protein